MESTTFIKLTRQQGLNTNFEAGGGGRWRGASPRAPAVCSRAQRPTMRAGSSVRPCDARRAACCLPSVSFPWVFASRGGGWGGGCPPLFVSDMSASPGKFCSPSARSEGAPGYRLRINEAANYIHLLRGSVPSNDPQHLRVPPPPPPTSFVFRKKELIIRKSHARRTNGRDLRRKITREYHFSPPTVWSRTPHRKPASPSP